jgi:hypothetical protein
MEGKILILKQKLGLIAGSAEVTWGQMESVKCTETLNEQLGAVFKGLKKAKANIRRV